MLINVNLEDFMTGKKNTDKFRNKAVELALNNDLTRNQVAGNFGVGHWTLGKWIAEHRHADLDDVQKQPKRLRKENKVLREERYFLPPPVAFIAS